jgi:hypothetical protein
VVIHYIEHGYLMPYVYSFCPIFQALRLFPALRLFQTLEYPNFLFFLWNGKTISYQDSMKVMIEIYHYDFVVNNWASIAGT